MRHVIANGALLKGTAYYSVAIEGRTLLPTVSRCDTSMSTECTTQQPSLFAQHKLTFITQVRRLRQHQIMVPSYSPEETKVFPYL
jgi:hypothetical protein